MKLLKEMTIAELVYELQVSCHTTPNEDDLTPSERERIKAISEAHAFKALAKRSSRTQQQWEEWTAMTDAFWAKHETTTITLSKHV